MKIYIIRHAQTESNLKEIACKTQKEEGLTKKGKEQAKKLAENLKKVRFNKIFISEAKRTYETILPLLKLKKNIPIKKDKRLNECEFGVFSGLTLKEAKRKYPNIFRARQKDQWNVPIPKGESYKDVALRLEAFLKDFKKDVKKYKFKNILIVTHATPLKVFLIKYLCFSIKKVESIYFENALVSIFDFQNGKIKPIIINNDLNSIPKFLNIGRERKGEYVLH